MAFAVSLIVQSTAALALLLRSRSRRFLPTKGFSYRIVLLRTTRWRVGGEEKRIPEIRHSVLLVVAGMSLLHTEKVAH